MTHGVARAMAILLTSVTVGLLAGVGAPTVSVAQPPDAQQPGSGSYRLVETLPSAAPAAGELIGATDLSVAPDGTVYVMDERAGRIQRFDATGAFVDMWGALGTAEGELAGEVDRFEGDQNTSRIAVGPTGVVFTSDHGLGRIEKFTSDGAYYTEWPGDVGDMAIMPDGTVFLTDWGTGEIRNHCPAGRCLERWGEVKPGRCLPVPRRVRSPIAVTADSRVVVAHAGTGLVQVCTGNGDLLEEWRLGEAVPEGTWAGDMALAPDGTLVFTGGAANAVLRFSDSGELVDTWGEPDGPVVDSNAQVSVSAEGDVYLLDRHGEAPPVVKRFTADGLFLASWGAKGTAVGQFRAPNGVAVAPDGTIVVADTENHRVQRFGARGQYLATIDVRDLDSGEIGDPLHVAVGDEGTLYVTDSAHNLIRVYDAEGVEIAVWRADDLEPAGMIVPRGITTAHDGSILVVDDLERRVVRFSTDGRVLQTIGDTDVGTRLQEPADVVVGSDGAVYVTDAQLGVRRFSAEGDADDDWSTANADLWISNVAYGLAISTDGRLLVGVRPRGDGPVALLALDHSGALVEQWDVPAGWMQVRASYPAAVATAASGAVYVADRLYDRLLILDQISGRWSAWDNDATDAGRMDRPVDMAIAGDGTMYVADGLLDRVQHVDQDGVSIAQWGPLVAYPTGRAFRFDEIHGVAVVADGRVIVTDGTADTYVFSGSGELLDIWRLGRGGWRGPLMPAAGADGAIYVLDTAGAAVGRLDADGNVVAQWGAAGTAPGEMMDPAAIDVGPDGTVYVADTGNGRVQRFDSSGGFMGEFRVSDRHNSGRRPVPEDVSVASDGTVFVAGSVDDRVTAFAADGALLGTFTTPGPAALGAISASLVIVAPDLGGELLAFGTAPRPTWRLSFFDNPWLAGAPVHVERIEAIDMDWGAQAPHETLLPDGWSARFDRVMPEGAGLYEWVFAAEGGVRFWLDDKLPVDEWPGREVSESVTTSTWGVAESRLEFADRGGPARVRLDYTWTKQWVSVFLPVASPTD